MQLTVTRPVEIEAVCIVVDVPVRYGTEDIPADCPGRVGDRWRAVIDIDTGRVRYWSGGAVEIDMKVCDEGVYTLYDADGDPLAERRDYVPPCVPGRYGDYIEFAIGADGVVKGWGEYCTPARVAESFFPSKA